MEQSWNAFFFFSPLLLHSFIFELSLLLENFWEMEEGKKRWIPGREGTELNTGREFLLKSSVFQTGWVWSELRGISQEMGMPENSQVLHSTRNYFYCILKFFFISVVIISIAVFIAFPWFPSLEGVDQGAESAPHILQELLIF